MARKKDKESFGPERTFVIKPFLKNERDSRDHESALAEAISLAQAIYLEVVDSATVNIASARPATLLGTGKVAEYAGLIAGQNIGLTIIDHPLTPVQQRNLEKEWKCKVIDRTGLILEIFGARAQSKEGTLQVELAALNYQKSRLVRSWTHLERQRGGFGFMGGPGESQLEMDKRLITERIVRLKSDLAEVQRTRGLGRKARQRAGQPILALVGYTNAGKSTLFNHLTGAGVLAKDMLFATLDSTMRGMELPHGKKVILSDTVGFITDLPTHLIEAFRATLEEVEEADIILHIRDASHHETREQRDAVLETLATMGISEGDKRIIEVLNKIDLLPKIEQKLLTGYAKRASTASEHPPEIDGVRRQAEGGTVAISATTGLGMGALLALIESRLSDNSTVHEIVLDAGDGAAIAWLHAHGNVLAQKNKRNKIALKVEMDSKDYDRFQAVFEGKKKA